MHANALLSTLALAASASATFNLSTSPCGRVFAVKEDSIFTDWPTGGHDVKMTKISADSPSIFRFKVALLSNATNFVELYRESVTQGKVDLCLSQIPGKTEAEWIGQKAIFQLSQYIGNGVYNYQCAAIRFVEGEQAPSDCHPETAPVSTTSTSLTRHSGVPKFTHRHWSNGTSSTTRDAMPTAGTGIAVAPGSGGALVNASQGTGVAVAPGSGGVRVTGAHGSGVALSTGSGMLSPSGDSKSSPSASASTSAFTTFEPVIAAASRAELVGYASVTAAMAVVLGLLFM
ncbi:Uu.00g087380.m01.CDS01 [Anthostomella pinea]|uniref:Uu.00g087380.m01.CDS01 n=1 Tax=Anthostomella pinea TaxID=933095 RepID=A0AAI8VMY3_9PEZI|nr:Uu.00g087380.m01.CDS01 [Anthostomella pinea]